MKKVLVTTASFGGHPYLPEWKIQSERYVVDFHRYNDENFPSREKALHPRLKGKIPKMMEWKNSPGYDYYIWVDSRFEVSSAYSVEWMVAQCIAADAAFFRHPSRSSVSDELQHVLELMQGGNTYLLDRYKGEAMKEQVEMYKKDEFWKDNKLFACGAFIYTSEMASVMKEWFLHNCLYSVQDQLSLPYLLHRYKSKYNTIEMNIFDCPHFKYR